MSIPAAALPPFGPQLPQVGAQDVQHLANAIWASLDELYKSVSILATDATTSTGNGGVTSPLTTKGDIWIYNVTDTRLPIGTTAGQFLTVQASGLPAWTTLSIDFSPARHYDDNIRQTFGNTAVTPQGFQVYDTLDTYLDPTDTPGMLYHSNHGLVSTARHMFYGKMQIRPANDVSVTNPLLEIRNELATSDSLGFVNAAGTAIGHRFDTVGRLGNLVGTTEAMRIVSQTRDVDIFTRRGGFEFVIASGGLPASDYHTKWIDDSAATVLELDITGRLFKTGLSSDEFLSEQGTHTIGGVFTTTSNVETRWGSAGNAIIKYDATNMVIDAANAGSGILDVQTGMNATWVQLDTAFADGAVEGRLQWNNEDGTLEYGLPGGNVNLQVGQEVLFLARNITGVTIPDGSVVYINGASGSRPTIALAKADSHLTAAVAGLATEAIAHNSTGYVTSFGFVRGIDTSSIAAGAVAYLSATTAGAFTSTRPTAPDIKVFLGYSIFSNNPDGILAVNPTFQPTLNALSDVLETPLPDDGQILHWDDADDRWEKITPRARLCIHSYVDVKERNAAYNLHGMFEEAVNAGAVSSGSPQAVNVGSGKIIVVVNAGVDTAGSLTITGTSVDRDTGTETLADTDVLTIAGLTTGTKETDTDADGNIRWAFANAYITSKWFTGAISLSTADLDLSDIDVYVVAFEQFNDLADTEIETIDITAYATNTSAWLDAYLYLLEVTGDTCTITRQTAADIAWPASKVVAANRSFRLRRGSLGIVVDGTTDGIWCEVHLGPLVSTYWENINHKLWATVVNTL